MTNALNIPMAFDLSDRSAANGGGAFKVTNIGAGESRMDLSKQWLARPHDQRFLSLADLHAFTKARFDGSNEVRVKSRQFEVEAPEPETKDDLHKLYVNAPGLGEGIAFSHWSFGQIAGLAGAPAGYLRTLPSPIAADALNYGLRHNREVELVKGFANDGELRAVTGPDYGRIPDHEVVEALRNIAGNGTGDSRWKIPGTMDWRTMVYDPDTPVTKDTTTLFASDRDLFAFLVDDKNPIQVGYARNGEPDLMFRGFYVQNSEVGSASMKVAAFYLRALCCNRIMWGVEGFEELTIRHTKMAPDRFLETARPALQSFAEGSSLKLIEGVEKAKAAKVAADKEEALDWLAARKVPRKRALDILDAVEREEGHPARNVWDMAQGMTAVARTIPHTDERVALENEARKILDKVAA